MLDWNLVLHVDESVCPACGEVSHRLLLGDIRALGEPVLLGAGVHGYPGLGMAQAGEVTALLCESKGTRWIGLVS